jgi:hypothetical protein
MAQVVELQELEAWFLIHWDPVHPDVLMEFETRDEAEGALCTAFADSLIGGNLEVRRLQLTICSALEMLEDPLLRDALAAWDAQLLELDTATRGIEEDLFLSGGPILRPGRRSA